MLFRICVNIAPDDYFIQGKLDFPELPKLQNILNISNMNSLGIPFTYFFLSLFVSLLFTALVFSASLSALACVCKYDKKVRYIQTKPFHLISQPIIEKGH